VIGAVDLKVFSTGLPRVESSENLREKLLLIRTQLGAGPVRSYISVLRRVDQEFYVDQFEVLADIRYKVRYLGVAHGIVLSSEL